MSRMEALDGAVAYYECEHCRHRFIAARHRESCPRCEADVAQ